MLFEQTRSAIRSAHAIPGNPIFPFINYASTRPFNIERRSSLASFRATKGTTALDDRGKRSLGFIHCLVPLLTTGFTTARRGKEYLHKGLYSSPNTLILELRRTSNGCQSILSG
eukprot:scaffold2466_cov333-Pavlova_lutheri.AAC.5